MTIIEQWLNGPRDYMAGVALYLTYGNNMNLKRVFSHGPSDYNVEKLAYELEHIKHLGEATEKKKPVHVPQLPPQEYVPPVEPAPDRSQYVIQEKPELYHQLHREWRQFYKQASHLHQTQLGMDQHKNDRGKAARQIIELFENEISPRWEMLDYFEEHGHFPEVTKPEPIQYVTAADMLKRRNNLRTYITKYQDNPKKITQLAAWRKEIEYLNEKLNAVQQ